jgi:hypothetical protein
VVPECARDAEAAAWVKPLTGAVQFLIPMQRLLSPRSPLDALDSSIPHRAVSLLNPAVTCAVLPYSAGTIRRGKTVNIASLLWSALNTCD